MHKYTLRLSAPFIIAFVCLRHIFHEAHEFMHMFSAYLFTGNWGVRDFNNVQPYLSDAHPSFSQEVITALAGPAFNYIVCFIGAAVILQSKTPRLKSIGLVIIFAALPMARIFTAAFGGGDEFGVMRKLITNVTVARFVNIAAVTALLAFPLITAFKTLPRKHAWLTFLSFLFVPMLLEGTVVLAGFNYILKHSGSITYYFGTPAAAWMVLAVVTAIFLLYRKHIGSLLQHTATVQKKKQYEALAE